MMVLPKIKLMVAPRKSSSGLSLNPEERSRNMPSSSKSTESLHSNTSSSKGSAKVLYKRNAQANPNGRQPAFLPATSEVRQRVLSARRLRIKTFQNQLADAQQHIAELAHENRILRTLHKRQDLALSKYESTSAELPQLLHSHAEEIRVWQMKYRNLQGQNKELLQKIKQKENAILLLSDQNKHLTQLNKDKNLEERQRLSEKVHTLEMRLQERENDMKLMARRLQLESKSSKKELLTEQKKRKDALVQLEKVKLELSGYVKYDELNLNEKFSKISVGSMVSLANAVPGPDSKEGSSQNDLMIPFDKSKAIEQGGSQSSRTLSTDRSDMFLSTSRTTRKLSTNQKLVGKTSTHRGNGDGPSEENIFVKAAARMNSNNNDSARTATTSGSETNVQDENNYYDNDSEESLDNDDETPDDFDLENLLDITAKESKSNMPGKPEDVNHIRKEITEDYKLRESFLNTFCRQATPETGKSMSRKTKLLAALKEIGGDDAQK